MATAPVGSLGPQTACQGTVKWQSLGTSRQELTLDFTLPTGQSFRWRKSGDADYTGVLNQRLVRLRQEEDDVLWQVLARGPGAPASKDSAVIKNYFNLHSSLAEMSEGWAAQDPRFKLIAPYFPGARMLRQDPVECLFQFVCSSNNHISRIHGMVERLCSTYGTPLAQQPAVAEDPLAAVANAADPVAFYAFPTLQQLAKASEEDLRADGFGYRAKFITGTVAALLQKPEGGAEWLRALRQVPYKEASQALISLPGIGPKVAACICLFSLDKHEAIPVDTHVWQLATKFYTPGLKGKSLTPKVMVAVEDAFIDRFGSHAGWAHNVLFISDLASHKHHLPPHLQPTSMAKRVKPAASAESDPAPEVAPRKLLNKGGLKRSRVASRQTADDSAEVAAVEATAVKVQRKRRADGSEQVTATAAAVSRRRRK